MKHQASRLLAALFALVVFASASVPATAETKEIAIKISAGCNDCKAAVQKALKNENGVVESSVSQTEKTVTVKYDPAKTTPEKIRKAIAQSGYDADDVKAPKPIKCCDGTNPNCERDKAKAEQAKPAPKKSCCPGAKTCPSTGKSGCSSDQKPQQPQK